MSTRCTIAINIEAGWHLFEDAWDDRVWLEASNVPFAASNQSIEVELPPAIIAAIKAGSFTHERRERPPPPGTMTCDEIKAGHAADCKAVNPSLSIPGGEPGYAPGDCSCLHCNPNAWWMVVCAVCGNKRCPHATDHRFECTNSNEPNQQGSIYCTNVKAETSERSE